MTQSVNGFSQKERQPRLQRLVLLAVAASILRVVMTLMLVHSLLKQTGVVCDAYKLNILCELNGFLMFHYYYFYKEEEIGMIYSMMLKCWIIRGIGPSMFEGESLGLGAMYETRTIRVPRPFKVRKS